MNAGQREPGRGIAQPSLPLLAEYYIYICTPKPDLQTCFAFTRYHQKHHLTSICLSAWYQMIQHRMLERRVYGGKSTVRMTSSLRGHWAHQMHVGSTGFSHSLYLSLSLSLNKSEVASRYSRHLCARQGWADGRKAVLSLLPSPSSLPLTVGPATTRPRTATQE